MFKPKFFSLFKTFTKEQIIKDITAGVVVAIIALPLSIALAIASGATPEKGLHTAIIAGFLISFLGGSRVQIGGPTGAFVIIVFNIIQKYGYDGLLVATIMAGVFLIIFGLLKLGTFIRLIPYPITTGFTSGIAVVIFTTQIKDFLGLSIDKMPSGFISMWKIFLLNIHSINYWAFGIALASLTLILLWPKITDKIPGSLVAVILSSIFVYFFNMPVETIGSRFGEISSSLPSISIPQVSIEQIEHLIMPAMTIALLAGIESLLSAVVADGMIGGAHRPNTELIAQGVANIASASFGGLPATGAIARTAANVNNGGRTPLAGMTHAVVLLVMLVLLMPLAKYIPMAALAAILVFVAYNMSEWHSFKMLLKAPKSDITVLLVTFFLTVLIDLVVAIEIGMIFAALLFMKRMSDVTSERLRFSHDKITDDNIELKYFLERKNIHLPKGIGIYEINGPFFFGIADKFLENALQYRKPVPVLIIRMRHVPAMDATALHALRRLLARCKEVGTRMILSEVNEQPMKTMTKARFIDEIGQENITTDFESAAKRAIKIREQDQQLSA
ncbi:MAG TPA: SulP family inorganic anion transporter [Spirochaetota bacterium]|nr:SulP family inorganic anion transporter [Spirochaetota bacterium]HOK91263.1 SulP family inorganic anion transporter [Spirochaetota bacterium]HON15959.1 SulP family inorganic anion transporter [Spirochaetota bacterium]HPP94386.1 SulP family inorganic anion transporter [Spirochaetota bacterium]